MLLRTTAGFAGRAAGGIVAVALLGANPAAAAVTLGSVFSLVGVAAALPQPLSLLFDRTQDLSGPSRTRLRLGAGSRASWVGYALLAERPMVWLSAGFGPGCALVVCLIPHVRRTNRLVGTVTETRPAVTAATGQPVGGHVRSADTREVLAAAS